MEIEEFIAEVDSACETFLQARLAEVGAVSPAAEPVVHGLAEMLRGGKKLRPVLAWIGWRSTGSAAEHPAPRQLGVALELFQAAALIHDDFIDHSDSRRGLPSFHRRFAELHRESGFSGDGKHFGASAAVLAGDLALSWAGEAFDEAARAAAGTTVGTTFDTAADAAVDAAADTATTDAAVDTARRIFRTMHTQVITGQYLDVRAELAPPEPTEEAAVAAARTVLRYKAAKYSTEHPLVLGAALAGADDALRTAWAQAALPLGEAFQLRDDLLGVFGDPQSTGKPVGDDLREGKRTELVAYAMFRSRPADAQELESMLGDPSLSPAQVERALEILTAAGAAEEIERSIDTLTAQSRKLRADVEDLGVPAEVLDDFDILAERLVRRTR